MNRVYLCLGGNMGNREQNLVKAGELIAAHIGTIHHSSAIYETAAWGKEDEPDYLNQVLEVHTTLAAQDVLAQCMHIEKELGRTRDVKWESRLMDIDILFYNSEVIKEPHLKVPHPFLQDRMFVLKPLNEIAPELTHPVLKKTIAQLVSGCSDLLPVNKRTG